MSKKLTKTCYPLAFPVYARAFNEVVIDEGYDESSDSTIEYYWRRGDDPKIAALEMIAESEELDM